jgi:hypothetical protein
MTTVNSIRLPNITSQLHAKYFTAWTPYFIVFFGFYGGIWPRLNAVFSGGAYSNKNQSVCVIPGGCLSPWFLVTCNAASTTEGGENMDIFYHAANVFVWHPERAWAITVVFCTFFFASLALKRERRFIGSWMLLIPAVSWTLFGFMEQWCKIGKFDIRVDLLITWPAILVITVICCASWCVSLRKH